MPPDGHFGYGWGGPFSWVGLLIWGVQTLFWLGLIGFLIWGAVRLFTRRRPMAAPYPLAETQETSAIELLRRRYALGEIDADTFEAMLERLLASERYDRPAGMV